jgi:hypothetical protein
VTWRRGEGKGREQQRLYVRSQPLEDFVPFRRTDPALLAVQKGAQAAFGAATTTRNARRGQSAPRQSLTRDGCVRGGGNGSDKQNAFGSSTFAALFGEGRERANWKLGGDELPSSSAPHEYHGGEEEEDELITGLMPDRSIDSGLVFYRDFGMSASLPPSIAPPPARGGGGVVAPRQLVRKFASQAPRPVVD